MRILFFAQLKDATGCDFIEMNPPSPLTADLFWVELLRQFPALARHRPSVRLAKNLEYADAETRFGHGDEIALIPPVCGG